VSSVKYKKDLSKEEKEFAEQQALQQKRNSELYSFDYNTLVEMKKQNSKESSYSHMLYKFMKAS